VPAGAAEKTRRPPTVACAFVTDGSLLFVAHHDRVDVRSPADGAVLRTFHCELARITSLAPSPDGSALAVGGGRPGDSGAVLLVDPDTGDVLSRAGDFDDVVTSVAFARDGASLAAASADHSACVVNLTEGGKGLGRRVELAGHAAPVPAATFAPDGKTVVTASADRSLKVWDAASGRLLRTLSNHTDAVHCLAVRPRPHEQDAPPFSCASGGDDRTARVWQPGVGRMVRIVRGHDGPVLALAYSADGGLLFTAGVDGIIRVVEGDSDAVVNQSTAHDDWVYALAASPDGKTLASGDWSGEVRAWAWDASAKTLRRQW
jgi:WD40 repeat protein